MLPEPLPASALAPQSESPITPLFAEADKADSAAPAPASEPAVIRPLDFWQPSLFTPGQLRKLRARHEEFVRALATRFSIYLRLEFGVQLLALETVFYPHFIESVPNPTHLTTFKLEPMSGTGLLELSSGLGLAIVDRLCGGTGKVEDPKRELTEIETALLDQALRVLLKEWGQAVASLPEVNAEVLGHETNPRFLQASPDDTSLLAVKLEVRLAERTEKLHLAIPCEMLEPIVRQLTPPQQSKQKPQPSPASLKWNPELNSLKVPLSAEWAELEITARQLTQLKVGDVLPVQSNFLNQVQVKLAKIGKFTGRLGKSDAQWAVEITQVLKS